MSTLEHTLVVAARAVAFDPRSATSEQSVAYVVRAVEEFLASPPMETLRRVDHETRARVLPLLAERVRPVMQGLQDMLSVGTQLEVHGGEPVAWASALSDAISRLEDVFRGIGGLERTSPSIVRTGGGPSEEHWRVQESRPPGDDAPLDEILEDAMDLVRALQTEAMARARNEPLLDWDTVRRELDLDRE